MQSAAYMLSAVLSVLRAWSGPSVAVLYSSGVAVLWVSSTLSSACWRQISASRYSPAMTAARRPVTVCLKSAFCDFELTLQVMISSSFANLHIFLLLAVNDNHSFKWLNWRNYRMHYICDFTRMTWWLHEVIVEHSSTVSCWRTVATTAVNASFFEIIFWTVQIDSGAMQQAEHLTMFTCALSIDCLHRCVFAVHVSSASAAAAASVNSHITQRFSSVYTWLSHLIVVTRPSITLTVIPRVRCVPPRTVLYTQADSK